MLSQIPMSRDTLLNLKAEFDESLRIQQIERIVDFIYKQAIHLAKTSQKTRYMYDLDNVEKANMDDIVERLEILFPGCSITFSYQDNEFDAKYYANQQVRQQVQQQVQQQVHKQVHKQVQIKIYISIDWS